MRSNLLRKGWMLLLIGLAGCAGAEVSGPTQTAPIFGQRPSQIIVYPFATNSSQVTLNQSIFQRAYRDVSDENVDAQQQQIADNTAQNVCLEIVTKLNQKGYNAICQQRGVRPGENVLVVDGEFTDMSEGNRVRRMVIGFGAGASVLDTQVYVDQTLAGGGLNHVLSFTTHADSGKMPGAVVTGPAGAAAGGATAAATLGANVAAGGVKAYTSAFGYLGDKTAEQIVDAIDKYLSQQGSNG